MAQPAALLLASSPRLHHTQSEAMHVRRHVRRRFLRIAATGAVVLVAARTVVGVRHHHL
ncbi:MAG: hypothetical protein AB7V43_08265 [Acidimicrobiia bacterium]